MDINQIEKRIEEDPHHVDEVPVEAGDFDLGLTAAGEPAPPRENAITPTRAMPTIRWKACSPVMKK